MTDLIVKKVQPYNILFGSYAKGHPDGDSDVDLLVVAATDLPRYRAKALKYEKYLRDLMCLKMSLS